MDTRPTVARARRSLLEWLLWLIVGAALIALAYQAPAQHTVHVGLNDAAYVQNFNDPTNRWSVIDPGSQATEPLRWTRNYSDLIFPQIGLPASATIRWRGLRPEGKPSPTVRVLLNGVDELGVFPATGDWETHVFTITGGLTKPNDVFLELRVDPVTQTDDRLEGVQVDQASLSTSGWPIMPYPSQLLYGALATAFGAMLVCRRWQRASVAIGVALLFLLLYRLPLTGYPLRILPLVLPVALGVALAVRTLPRLSTLPRIRSRPMSDVLAAVACGLIVIGWMVWALGASQAHTVLSLPGVERDFGAFAPRALSLICPQVSQQVLLQTGCVLRADSFYQFGYPFLLWLFTPLAAGNVFLAGRLVAALSGGLLLVATGVLGWRLFGPSGAILAALVLAFSPLVAEYTLYVGTDMPFAMFWTVGLAALVVPRKLGGWQAALAGVLCGLAFIMRHPGLLLLPLGWMACALFDDRDSLVESGASFRSRLARLPWRPLAIFTLGWLAAALPQLAVNVADTGQPLYSRQAKNVWLAVYGNTDWGRANEASDDVSLGEVVRADPARFMGNWWRNLQVFAGTGAEDTSEFGQGIALRLLHFPANWLALAGLFIWLLRGTRRERFLLAASLIYELGIAIGFMLPRFFVPLAPAWALASVSATLYVARQLAQRIPALNSGQWATALGAALVVIMLSGPQIGAQYVYDHQDESAAAVAHELLPRLAPDDQVLFALPADDSLGRYSAIAHYATADGAQDARYIVWSNQATPPAAVGGLSPIATFGRYSIYSTGSSSP